MYTIWIFVSVMPLTFSKYSDWFMTLCVAMFLDPSMNPKCRDCQSMDIDPTFMKVFNCFVCKTCQRDKPEKYSLLTKTECKEDYLLTDRKL